jgi:8-oxo-dGTP pyrophosphatase MutT (NUDIX family)
MKDYKVIHSDNNFDVVEVMGQRGFKAKTMSVAVMPFTTDENSIVDKIGFLKEFNPFREGNYANTLITGTVESEEQDLIQTVIRELKEEGGIECPQDQVSRIIYLGNFYPYKDSDRMVPTFAVDVTSLTLGEPEGDGSKKEELSSFHLLPVTDAMSTDELLPLAAFLRLFNFFYTKTLGTDVQS